MVFGVFGIHEEVSLFMITNPIRHPLPFTLKTLCFIHPFWTNCSYPSECDDMKTWLISVLLMLITVPSVVKRRRNGTRLSLNWPRHIKPASLLWQSYNKTIPENILSTTNWHQTTKYIPGYRGSLSYLGHFHAGISPRIFVCQR